MPLFIGFNRRFDPQFRRVKIEASAGRIGTAESLLIISRDPSPLSVEYIRVFGGMFRDMTIHDLDMARFIMGEEPVSILAQGSNLVDPVIGEVGDVDTAVVVLKFASGTIATIVNSRSVRLTVMTSVWSCTVHRVLLSHRMMLMPFPVP